MSHIYLDIYIQSVQEGTRIRLRPLPDQDVELTGRDLSLLHVSCSRSLRKKFPIGTIFKCDVQLVEKGNGIKPYLKLREGSRLERAIDYFDHNLKLQHEK